MPIRGVVRSDGTRALMNVDSDRDQMFQEDEEHRRQVIARNRTYYDGSQYDEENEALRDELMLGPDEPLPEHERLHAYSTHIAECVDFIASQLTDGFRIVCDDERAQQVIESAITATDTLTGGADDAEINFDDVIIDAEIAGDVPVEVRWDPFEQTVYLDLWPAEDVQFDVPSGQSPRNAVKVERTAQVWVPDPKSTSPNPQMVEVQERVLYEMAWRIPDELELETNPNAEPVYACRRRTYHDDDARTIDTPVAEGWVMVPFIPWTIIRADRRGLKGVRGAPLITDRAIGSARRYDATEQQGYKITRYNAHGNLVVIGDAAMTQVEARKDVAKDVADVLTFPGGTNAFALTLPTQTDMLEHQERVTSDAIYRTFGLTRVEPDTMQYLGAPSGYALEILNRKTEGTFRRVRRMLAKDISAMANMILDMYAWLVDGDEADLEDESAEEETKQVDPDVQDDNQDPPDLMFPNRGIDIRLGSGYVVDDVMQRDDFVARIISRAAVLRQRGWSDPDIKKNERELKKDSESEGTQQSDVDAAAQRAAQLSLAQQPQQTTAAPNVTDTTDTKDQP